MSNSLSGTKIIQQATLMTEAVSRIGGAANLTERNQARVNATLTEALAQLKAIGQEGPKAMLDLEKATRQAAQPTTALSVAVGVMAAELAKKASMAVIGFGKEALITSAKVETLGGVAEFMGARSGFTAAEIDGLSSALRRQGITTQESYNVIVQMTRANLSLASATDLATVAQSLARATGENSSATLAKLIQGIQTLNLRVLRTAGAYVQLDQEYKKFADTHDRTVESLTTEEKQQIILAAVIRDGEKVLGIYGKTNEYVGGKIQSMARHQEEAARAIGDVFKPALKVGVDVMTSFLQVVQRMPDVFAVAGLSVVGLAGAFTALKTASALSLISTTALTTGLGVLGPALAVVATGFASVKAGLAIGEWTHATNAVQRLTGFVLGLSQADITASIAAREFQETAAGKTAKLDQQALALKSLEGKALAAEAAANKHAEAQRATAQRIEETNAAMDKLRQKIAPDFSKDVDYLTELFFELNHEGGLTPAVLAAITEEATKLSAAGAILTAELLDVIRVEALLRSVTPGLSDDFNAMGQQVGLNLEPLKTLGENAAFFAEQAAFDAETAKMAAAGMSEIPAAANAATSAVGGMAQGFGLLTQQVQLNGDAIRAWIALQQYAAKVNAILSQNRLFTSTSQLEAIGNIPIPSFASGVSNFSGGPAIVGERGPELVNLPRGSSVTPSSALGGNTVIVNAPGSFFDTPSGRSKLARAVSDALDRQLRSRGI
ncbi:MAG: hypothetical protein ABII76_27300, partial [Pseudomonadota bacterium]